MNSARGIRRKNRRLFCLSGVTPQQRLRILDAWQGRGDIVAMTSRCYRYSLFKAADLGVAMDKMGTDVSKSAADILIKDDSFTTLD